MSATGTQQSQATGGGSQDRLAKVCQSLSSHRSAVDRGTNVTGIVGTIVIAAVFGWLYYGYTQIAPLLEPDELVRSATGLLTQNLQPVRTTLEGEIKKSAPNWAKDSAQHLIKTIPQGREWAEETIMTKFDETIDMGRALTRDEMRKFLRINRKDMEAGFVDIAKSPQKAEKLLGELQVLFEKQFGFAIKEDADVLLATLREINTRLGRLVNVQRLTDEESLERQILRIARRLEMREADPQMTQSKVLGPASSGTRASTGEADGTPTKAVAKEPAKSTTPAKGSAPEGKKDGAKASPAESKKDTPKSTTKK